MKAKEIEKLLRIYVPSKTLLGNNKAKLIAEIQELALRQKWGYAKQKCKEQRGIFSKLVFPNISTMEDEVGNIYLRQDEIENIPQPKFK